MQYDQFKGMLDRAIAILATMLLGWMVRNGWLGESDSATLLPAVVLLPSLIWGAWVNRDKALVQSAAAVPGTTVITTPELAKSTPDESNIISNIATPIAIAAAVEASAPTSPVKQKRKR